MTTTSIRTTNSALAALLFVPLSCVSCGGTAPAPPPPRAEPRPLQEGPLTDFVPAAGLKWMIVGRPRDLAQDAALREPLQRLFPEQRLDAFADATGIDLRRTSSALVAQFDYATLYMAETDGPSDSVEAKFVERLVSEPVRSARDPRVPRVTGLVGSTPETLVRVGDDFIAVSVGDPTPARVVELFATGHLKRVVPALRGSALSTLPPDLNDGVVRGYAPGPFEHAWARGARGLLSSALAAGVAAYPREGWVRVVLTLSGQWDAGIDLPRLLGAWEDLAASSLGRLLGLNEPKDPPAVDLNGDVLMLEVFLQLRPLLSGLHAAVAADVWQLMDFSGASEKPRAAPM